MSIANDHVAARTDNFCCLATAYTNAASISRAVSIPTGQFAGNPLNAESPSTNAFAYTDARESGLRCSGSGILANKAIATGSGTNSSCLSSLFPSCWT